MSHTLPRFRDRTVPHTALSQESGSVCDTVSVLFLDQLQDCCCGEALGCRGDLEARFGGVSHGVLQVGEPVRFAEKHLCAELLCKLMAQTIDGDEFEDAMEDLSTDDAAISAMYMMGWSTYADGRREAERLRVREAMPELVHSGSITSE